MKARTRFLVILTTAAWSFCCFAECDALPPNGKIAHRAALEDATNCSILRDYAAEFKLNNFGKPEPFNIGLALSGGGTRAGDYANGVMHGLLESGALEHVDVISSVSGGGYAAYWYFARRMILGDEYKQAFHDCVPTWFVAHDPDVERERRQKLLKIAADIGKKKSTPSMQQDCGLDNVAHYVKGDPYRWQAHLARWQNVFAVAPTVVDGTSQQMPTKEIMLAVVPGVLSKLWSKNSDVGERYEAGIDREWALEPKQRIEGVRGDDISAWTYENARTENPPGSPYFGTDSKQTNWGKWVEWRKRTKHAPHWILNARIHGAEKEPYPDNIFEITGYGMGSQTTGFTPDISQIDSLAKSVRLSAAFLDTQNLALLPAERALVALPEELTGIAGWGEWIRMPEHLFPVKVSDGGSEDNLGVISLVKRGVRNIIIADGTYDASGKLEDLCRVQIALGKKGIELKMQLLDNFDYICAEKGENAKPQYAYSTSAWMNPVVKGTIRWLDGDDPAKDRPHPINLFYVKMAWDQQSIRRSFNSTRCEEDSGEFSVDCMLAVFYSNNTTVLNKDGYLYFPQLETPSSTLKSSTYLYWAYRALGRSAAKHVKYVEPAKSGQSGSLEMTQARSCQQPALCAAESGKLRPGVPMQSIDSVSKCIAPAIQLTHPAC